MANTTTKSTTATPTSSSHVGEWQETYETMAYWMLRVNRQIYTMQAQHKLMHECFKLGDLVEQQACLPACKNMTQLSECHRPVFWQVHYEPSFSCVGERRIGYAGEGGKWICDPHTLKANIRNGGSCLVYSIGSHGQYDFEEAVHNQLSPSCEIHTIDRFRWKHYTGVRPPPFVNYHVYTLGQPPRGTPVSTILSDLGHRHRIIELFKIDCEGCEFATYSSWFDEGVYIKQILVEVHGTDWDAVHVLFRFLFKRGYVIFHKESNTLVNGRCIEYAFVKMSPQFALGSVTNAETMSLSQNEGNVDEPTAHSMSLNQSEGYMNEPTAQWMVRVSRQVYTMQAQRELMRNCFKLGDLVEQQACLPACKTQISVECKLKLFWQVHYEPSFSCVGERRIGNAGEGGKWICDPHTFKAKILNGGSCLVYSIGSHGQYDFEEAVHSQLSPSCEIHMFHWTNYTKHPPPPHVTYHVGRVGSPPEDTPISTFMNALGHRRRVIDILKIDCDGCELQSYSSWFGEGIYIRQLLVTFHGTDWDAVHGLFGFLFKLGYVVFHKEPSCMRVVIFKARGSHKGPRMGPTCFEYAFLKMSAHFVGADAM